MIGWIVLAYLAAVLAVFSALLGAGPMPSLGTAGRSLGSALFWPVLACFGLGELALILIVAAIDWLIARVAS